MRRFAWTPGVRMAAAAVSAVVAMTLTIFHTRAASRKLSEGLEVERVWRIKRYTEAGRVLAPGLLESALIPRAYLPPGALPADEPLEGADGRARFRLRTDMSKGEVVARPRLDDASSRPGAAWLLPEGFVGAGVRLPIERAAGGLVRPGDSVDVIYLDGAAPPSRVARLLQNVPVLAVQGEWGDGGDSRAPAARPVDEPHIITLMLTPRDAGRLSLADARGIVSLVLAAPGRGRGPSFVIQYAELFSPDPDR